MSERDTTFVTGTVVEPEYLNSDQDKDIGAVWGLKISQPSTSLVDRLFLESSSYDARYPVIINGKRAWREAPTSPVIASGAVGTRNIWVNSSAGTLPNFNVQVIPTAETPAGSYQRKIGTAEWNGTTLYDIKLSNGVQADASQFNAFVFKSIGQSSLDTPLKIQGYDTQNTSSTSLLSISADTGGTQYTRFSVTGDGAVVLSPAAAATTIFKGQQYGDSYARVSITAAGAISIGSGSGAADTTLSRTASGTLKVDSTLDVATIYNSTGTNSGRVLFNDSINLSAGSNLYFNGTALSASALSDYTDLVRITGTQTISGAKTFSSSAVFTGGATFSSSGPTMSNVAIAFAASATSSVIARSIVSAQDRFTLYGGGKMVWSDGAVPANDAELTFSGANVLTTAATTRLQVPYVATANNDVVNKITMTNTISSMAATKAFAYFMS